MLNNAKNFPPYDYLESTTFYLFSVVALLVAQFFVGVVLSALLPFIPDLAENGDFNAVAMIFFQAVNVLLIYLFSRIKKRRFNFDIYVNRDTGRRVTVKTILLPIAAAVVLMAGMYLPTVWYGYLTEAMGIPPEAGAIQIDTVSALVLLIFASVVLAPVFEETIYRGILLHGLRDENSTVKAALLSALAFMLMHLSPLQTIYQFALGFLSAMIALKTKRLLPSIILHASSNALALIVEVTPFITTVGYCVDWLVARPLAATFITLGLFAVAFGILFVIVKWGLTEKKMDGYVKPVESKAGEPIVVFEELREQVKPQEKIVVFEELREQEEKEEASINVANESVEEMRKKLKKKDGTVRFYIGIGICVLMLIVNTVTLIIS